MSTDKSNPQHPSIEHFVPGYGFYDEVGTGLAEKLAEKLVELIEFLVAALRPLRR